ncbi:hypothetical protein [Miniphocaeibacter massiliensis]|nr:hypothetical protein [Miniphocaeibacter massiliensis]
MSKEFIGLEPDEVIEYDDELGKITEDERIKNGTDNYEGSSLDGKGEGDE